MAGADRSEGTHGDDGDDWDDVNDWDDANMANTTCREEFRTNTPHDPPATSFPPKPVDGPGVVEKPVTHPRRNRHPPR